MSRLLLWISRCREFIAHRLMLAFELHARSWRYLLLAAGMPISKEYLVLRCAGGPAVSGLFSEFAAVLGALEHYEKWNRIYAGLHVDFSDRGLYYEPAHGANWWEYYFERIYLGGSENAVIKVISDRQHDLFAYRIDCLSREHGFALIERHIRAKLHIREKVDAYVRANFREAYVIGVHYRGTDKFTEAPRVAYERVHAAVLDAINAARPARHKLFIATDEAAFLDYMLNLHPSGLLYRDIFRSIDGTPTHWRGESNHDKGEDAVLDFLLLSRCQILIRTASNLSQCSTLINPEVPEVMLSRGY